MGKRKRRQDSLWVAAVELPTSPGHPFYQKLNAVLETAGFDAFVEKECQRFYAPVMGRPSLAPGRYFRLLMLGYFEGLDSERAIAWRACDSLAIRKFLRLGLDEGTPDHSTISRTRRLIDVETHRAVFTWILQRLASADLLRGKTIGVDATTLEANAAMRSIVRRDSGESYQEFLLRLAKSSGIKTPSREALARLDRRRRKRTSNQDWTSPSDPDAKITKMKDGRTHLAHKAEHAVDMATGAIVAVTVQGADRGDTSSLEQTLTEADKQIEEVAGSGEGGGQVHAEGLSEVVTDRGYHSAAVLIALEDRGLRSYIPEPQRKRRSWEGDLDAQLAVYANRRRVRGERGRRLLRSRGELIERGFAHVYDTGGMRRTHLRGHPNILKRLLIHTGASNLGLLLRQLLGRGTPRGLQGYPTLFLFLLGAICSMIRRQTQCWIDSFMVRWRLQVRALTHRAATGRMTSATGC
jgi:transposase